MRRWRVGRHNQQLIYRMVGPEPSKDDRLTLVAFSASEAIEIVKLLNRAEPACYGDQHVNPHRSCIMR